MTSTIRRTRGAGLLPAAVLLTALLTAAASSQWLETTIPVPDSLSILSAPETAILDSVDNEVYVAGETHNLLVLDGTTGEKLRRIELPNHWTRFILLNPVSRVAYCPARRSTDLADVMLVLDLATDSVIAELEGFGIIKDYCLVPELNKAYFTDVEEFIIVVDGATHQVVDTIPVRSDRGRLCYNPTAGKVFCSMSYDSALAVIDPATDSLLRHIDVGPGAWALSCSPAENKVYASYGDPATIAVVDCATDSIVARIEGTTSYWFTGMFYNPNNNRLYCCEVSDTVTVIDCAGDSLLKRISARSPDPEYYFEGTDFCWAPEFNRLYCRPPYDVRERWLMVIDCAADTLVKLMTVGRTPTDMVYNPRSGRMFTPNWHGASVAVVDCARDTVESLTFTYCQVNQLAYCPRENKVYAAGLMPEAVFVIDGATNQVVATIPMLHTNSQWAGAMSDLCCNPVTNTIYASCFEDQSVTVIDCAADTIVTRLYFFREPSHLCYCPLFGSRVFCGEDDELYVIDGQTNTVIDTILLPPWSDLGRMVYAAGSAKLYCETGSLSAPDFVAVDCSTGTLGTEFRTGGSMSLVYSPAGNKVYLAGRQPVVVDCATDSVLGVVPSSEGWWYTAGYNDLENKIYFAEPTDWLETYRLLIVDGETDSVLAEIEDPGGGRDLSAICYNRMNNKVYVSCENSARVTIIDGETDAVIDSIHVGSMPQEMVWNPVQNRVYVANINSGTISIIADSLVPGVAEDKAKGGRLKDEPGLPTILRGPELKGRDCRVIDALGRDVTDRREHLAPGVYFLRSATDLHRPASDVTKVLVLR